MNRPKKIVITDYEFSDLSLEREILAPLRVDLIEGIIGGAVASEDEVIRAVADADAVISQNTPIRSETIDAMSYCKVIARYGIGVDLVDVMAAKAKGIAVCNVPDYSMEEVTDHALAFLLNCSRKIDRLNRAVKQGVWDFKQAVPLYRLEKQVLGLYGFGRMSRRLLQKAAPLGLKVIAHDPYVPYSVMRECGVDPVSMEDLFRLSDYISVHVPLTEQTRGSVDKQVLVLMKPNSVLINTSRGPIINESDLADALIDGRLAGACLDVAVTEPIPRNHPFLRMDNVLLTPHAAWYSEESMIELREKTARNVLEVLQGRQPLYQV